MIFTKPQVDLQHSINRMELPVFVLDRGKEGEFHVVALNEAHTKESGLSLDAAIAKTPQMILQSRSEAEFLNSRYRTCITERRPVTYSTRLTFQDGAREIRSILHPISMDGSAPTRIVGEVAISPAPRARQMPGVSGDHGILAEADILAMEILLNKLRDKRTICSKDLMMLGTLRNNRNLSFAEAVCMVERYDHARKVRAAAISITPGRGPFAELSEAL
ncbi:MAG: hypothetical protein P8I56_01895 [Paracoccaceae bacterium]|jgi:hypothetical protein|nr:hypothetical protein [Paracoccaceae bacterium]